jgi:serine/threonine-protein kinase
MQGKILLARYEILQPLAQGGFSNTYIAKDLQNSCLCVVKHLYLTTTDSTVLQEAKRLFKIEAEILEKLSENPQVPKILDYCEQDKQFYIVQEFIEGQTLTTKLQPNQPWSELEVLEMLKDVLQILEYIHSLGVIHRDLKPDNLIIRDKDKKFVLIDFGAVKEFNPQQSQVISQTIAIGTRGYMPLEQIKGKPRKNSDLYALGIIAIQALTGRNPIDLEENNQGELIWQPHAQVSSTLAEVLNKMIQIKPQDRYQSVVQILKDLEKPTVIPPSEVKIHPKSKTINQAKLNMETKSSANKLFLWLKSPTGKNITFALGLSLVATVGVYYLSSKEKADKLANIEVVKNQLETAFNNRQYEECFKQAQTPETIATEIPENQRIDFVVKCGLGIAEVLAEQLKFAEAIQKLNEIPPNPRYAPQLTQQADIWVESLIKEASQAYTKDGDLSESLEMLSAIPATSKLREDGESLAREWKAESSRLEILVKKAELALEYKGYQEVIGYAKEISNTTTTNYWLLKAKELAEKAYQEISKNNSSQKNSSMPKENPSNKNNNDQIDNRSESTNSHEGIEVPEALR